MGFTRKVQDPVSGEWIWVTSYLRKGKVVTQRLAPHLFREGLTPRRMEAMADFTEAAMKSYGTKQTGPLPPAAEEVRRELRRRRAVPRESEK